VKKDICRFGCSLVYYAFEKEIWATIARRIWTHINTLVFGEEFTHLTPLVRSAKESVEKFHTAALSMRNHNKKLN
jgi:hypothetical protein